MESDKPVHVDFWPGNHLSYTTTKIDIFRNEILLSSATGFVMRYGQTYALVTNWHVLSGINPANGSCLSPTGAIPAQIRCHVTISQQVTVGATSGEQLFFKPIIIDLYEGEMPVWLENREHFPENDYAAIDLGAIVPELADPRVSLRSIRSGVVTLKKGRKPPAGDVAVAPDDFQSFYPPVGKEVFVLGYPKGITSTGVFPIWKRASIASEPQAPTNLRGRESHDVFYIDATTKHGMSGSPVICLAKPGDLFVTMDGVQVETEKEQELIVGVYAGREGVTQEEYELSLGRVWKIGAIEEMIRKGQRASGIAYPKIKPL
ncbi:hypothetical protein IZ6_05390 [Terrihabitans soli]|uniref:Trypsin-like peptidase domain-containing protein n=1 Tax=Terrihabitans soli TaxID=708113 RepID=A0A6S6QHX8_9HYPH|nr:trypsin-like peptidase domain-containing protein [Terrihabitans soli]BCJ89804.1 hypothetical protein IZ6_05390 [Terrihabitans soli]